MHASEMKPRVKLVADLGRMLPHFYMLANDDALGYSYLLTRTQAFSPRPKINVTLMSTAIMCQYFTVFFHAEWNF